MYPWHINITFKMSASQTQAFVRMLILALPAGTRMCCMQARQHFQKTYGFDIDHHEYSDAFDHLTRSNPDRVVNAGFSTYGNTLYEVK